MPPRFGERRRIGGDLGEQVPKNEGELQGDRRRRENDPVAQKLDAARNTDQAELRVENESNNEDSTVEQWRKYLIEKNLMTVDGIVGKGDEKKIAELGLDASWLKDVQEKQKSRTMEEQDADYAMLESLGGQAAA